MHPQLLSIDRASSIRDFSSRDLLIWVSEPAAGHTNLAAPATKACLLAVFPDQEPHKLQLGQVARENVEDRQADVPRPLPHIEASLQVESVRRDAPGEAGSDKREDLAQRKR